MRTSLFRLSFALLLIPAASLLSQGMPPAGNSQYVNPFIGSVGGGNTFPGVSLPFGLVKLGPDCAEKGSNSGYEPDSPVRGFSHVHVSGTGGGPKYGNILFLPVCGDSFSVGDGLRPSREYAEPGYFRITLERYGDNREGAGQPEQGIIAELTASHSVGFHQYTFPESSDPRIIIDVASLLGPNHCCGEKQEFVDGEITVESDSTINGYSTVKGGWNQGPAYRVYFYALFEQPFDSCLARGKYVTEVKYNKTAARSIKIKVGISFLSTRKARENIDTEIPHWDFQRTRLDALGKWNAILDRVQIDTDFPESRVNFYSSLYRCYLMPANRSGECSRIDGVYYDDYYAIWDTYRTTDPLRLLLTPGNQRDILNSLLNIYRAEGYLPDARSGNANGRTQGGSNADILLAEAFVKGIQGIDYETALKAMLTDAEVPPADAQKEGRGGLEDYNRLGYVSSANERSGTRTMEYSYCDYAVAVLAEGMGHKDVAAKYYKKAGNWQNLWRDKTVDGITGFIWPRERSGAWVPDSSFLTESGTWPDYFYEGTTWEYSLFAPHDMRRLIVKCGGRDKTLKRLDHLFDRNYYNVANEPSFLFPLLYHWIGRPDKSSERVRRILKKYYQPTRDGLPGNDDSGAMAAWYVFNSLGLYPVAGTDFYLLVSPSVKRTAIELENGNRFEIIASGLSEDNIYIVSAKLNGAALNRTWLTHAEIVKGGTLLLEMGAAPSGWGQDAVPPSLPEQPR